MKTPYIFFRGDMFYPIELEDDADARANAECNPGTTRVEDIHGRIVWKDRGADKPQVNRGTRR